MRVGVIVAVRGPAPYLHEALESVHAQEPAPDAVVVVDHASVPPLAEATVRVDDAGGGPAAARQAGLARLDTELVAIADADDVWEPGKLAAQLETIGDAAVSFGRAVVIDAAGRPPGEQLPELARGLHRASDLASQLYERNAIPAASVLIRRDAL